MIMAPPEHRATSIRALAAFATLLGALLSFPARAQIAPESALKASFIAKFVAFVKWPPPRGPSSAADTGVFRVAVFGTNPFHDELEAALKQAGPAGRPVRVEIARDLRDLRGSRLVFIGASERRSVAKVAAWAEANGALTIGDGEGFAEEGIIINFYPSGSKVRFEINASAAERSGFQISSLLLKVARIVEDG
jgi:hypothetical protein